MLTFVNNCDSDNFCRAKLEEKKKKEDKQEEKVMVD